MQQLQLLHTVLFEQVKVYFSDFIKFSRYQVDSFAFKISRLWCSQILMASQSDVVQLSIEKIQFFFLVHLVVL